MQPRTGISRIYHAFFYSIDGLKHSAIHEAAFKQELLLCIPMMPLALWLGDGPIEKILLIMPLFLLLIVELLNTAIEALADRIGTEIHPLIKVAKDVGSAAVLMTMIFGALVWVLILLPSI